MQILTSEGLDEIRLGGISVGGTQAVIREFLPTETTFVANSNNVVFQRKKHLNLYRK